MIINYSKYPGHSMRIIPGILKACQKIPGFSEALIIMIEYIKLTLSYWDLVICIKNFTQHRRIFALMKNSTMEI